MIYTFDDLRAKFPNHTDIKGKIRREIQNERLIPISRGLYETNPQTSGKYLAGRIYGPSYLSFEYALSEYSLIPEAVVAYTSATFCKRRTKMYQNTFGRFMYRDIPAEVYPLGIMTHEENGYSYQIATPEKALCDKLYTISPVGNLKEMKELLFDDLRIDDEELAKFNLRDLNIIAPLYHSTNVKLFARFMQKNI